MAWARIIDHKCQRCDKRANREVLNRQNTSYGYFCAAHAKQEVDRLCRHEAADDRYRHLLYRYAYRGDFGPDKRFKAGQMGGQTGKETG